MAKRRVKSATDTIQEGAIIAEYWLRCSAQARISRPRLVVWFCALSNGWWARFSEIEHNRWIFAWSTSDPCQAKAQFDWCDWRAHRFIHSAQCSQIYPLRQLVWMYCMQKLFEGGSTPSARKRLILRQVRLGRTGMLKASMAKCVTNFWTGRYSIHSKKRTSSSSNGAFTTTQNILIPLSDIARQRQKQTSRQTRSRSCTNFQDGSINWGWSASHFYDFRCFCCRWNANS